jgi:hypothetical protein
MILEWMLGFIVAIPIVRWIAGECRDGKQDECNKRRQTRYSKSRSD